MSYIIININYNRLLEILSVIERILKIKNLNIKIRYAFERTLKINKKHIKNLIDETVDKNSFFDFKIYQIDNSLVKLNLNQSDIDYLALNKFIKDS